MAEIQYNDYTGYFDSLESDEPLKIQKNVKLFKNLQAMIDEYFSIAANQELEQMRKDTLIQEMATTMEQIYINTGKPHLVETIASSLCLILNKKDKITSPSYIYEVLEKKFKNRYSSEYGHSKRGEIFAKRNVKFQQFREGLAAGIKFFMEMPELENEKKNELTLLLNRFDDARTKAINSINGFPFIPQPSGLPEEDDSPYNDDKDGDYPSDGEIEESGNYGKSELEPITNEVHNSPQQYKSKYYYRLEQYIGLLQKLKDNVLRFPPSKELDDKLDKSLELEMEVLMPSIDMKFKRSIPQLDETIQYADNQSLNGASSVMHESALLKDFRGNIIDPHNAFNKFLEVTHKLTPEQIDTRRPYISVVRKKMKFYQPHIFYHLLWYEGAEKMNHKLSMGKFARSNLLKKKVG